MWSVCDFDGWVTFVGVGMAGAVHDMRVLREAWMKPRLVAFAVIKLNSMLSW